MLPELNHIVTVMYLTSRRRCPTSSWRLRRGRQQPCKQSLRHCRSKCTELRRSWRGATSRCVCVRACVFGIVKGLGGGNKQVHVFVCVCVLSTFVEACVLHLWPILHLWPVIMLRTFPVIMLHTFSVIMLHTFLVIMLHTFLVIMLHTFPVIMLHTFPVIMLRTFPVVMLCTFPVFMLRTFLVIMLRTFPVTMLHTFLGCRCTQRVICRVGQN